jgi:hypothetical protein
LLPRRYAPGEEPCLFPGRYAPGEEPALLQPERFEIVFGHPEEVTGLV